ncbi:MAG: NADH-quinone oxidoreductase subunit NuoN [Pseudomonadota bacterium]
MSDGVVNLSLIAPELALAIGAMLLLMLGVFQTRNALVSVYWGALAAFAVSALLMLQVPGETVIGFSGLFISDGFAVAMKLLILLGSAVALIMSRPYLKETGLARFEFPVLVVIATLGMLMMVSANSLMSLYVGLELQSLSLYVLASFHRDSTRSAEAGLKYFVLGALSSGLLLYGSSLLYGYTGSTEFGVIKSTLSALQSSGDSLSGGIVFGLVFVLAGLIFKISAVPFHMWTPDVYEGAPTPVTAFFAGAPKVAAMALLMRVLYGSLHDLLPQWQMIIMVVSVLSMLLGAIAAIAQTNIKRLMAYSSIGHVGYALVGVAAGTQAGVEGVMIYMALYLVMTVGSFLCILAMHRADGMVEDISELSGLSSTRPGLALALATFMISLIGFPPFAGFYGKLYVFKAAIDADLFVLAIIGVVTSVIGAFYYLRIVKIMYFDEPSVPLEPIPDRSSSLALLVTAVTASPAAILLVPMIVPAFARAAATLYPLAGG